MENKYKILETVFNKGYFRYKLLSNDNVIVYFNTKSNKDIQNVLKHGGLCIEK